MEALRERFTYILESGWDEQSLLLLGIVALLLALWLLMRILRHRPQAVAPSVNTSARVVPPPLPKIEMILTALEGEFPEFVEIVRDVMTHTGAQKLLTHAGLRRNFAHLEMLLQRAERASPRGTLGIAGETRLPGADARRDAKATMLTIIRQLQEVEGVSEKSDIKFNDLVDRFLEIV